MERYEKYKDSGINWLGEIPHEWSMSTIGREFFVKAGGDVNRDDYSDMQSDEFRYPIYTNTVKESAPYGYTRVANYKSNTITVTGRGDVGYAAYRDHPYDAIIRLLVLTPKKENFCKYFAYFINAIINFQVGSSAIGQLSTQQIAPYPICLPTVNEQNEICNYLDSKVAQIDILIADKEKLTDLLQEKRQSIISEAVTKGLDPTVPMKDSGIEWIGEVPVHWGIKKVKHVAKTPLAYGANESAESDDPSQPRYIRITDIDESGNLRGETFKSLSLEIAAPYLLYKDDILFARSGATVGKTYLHASFNGEACFAGYLIRLSVDKRIANPKYLYYFTQSKGYWDWVCENTIQATIQNISAEKYGNLKIPFPSKETQDSIVTYLDRKISDIDQLLDSVDSQIIKLHEYRKSIISEAVTGKVKITEGGEN